jgi:hypothetical protein
MSTLLGMWKYIVYITTYHIPRRHSLKRTTRDQGFGIQNAKKNSVVTEMGEFRNFWTGFQASWPVTRYTISVITDILCISLLQTQANANISAYIRNECPPTQEHFGIQQKWMSPKSRQRTRHDEHPALCPLSAYLQHERWLCFRGGLLNQSARLSSAQHGTHLQ